MVKGLGSNKEITLYRRTKDAQEKSQRVSRIPVLKCEGKSKFSRKIGCLIFLSYLKPVIRFLISQNEKGSSDFFKGMKKNGRPISRVMQEHQGVVTRAKEKQLKSNKDQIEQEKFQGLNFHVQDFIGLKFSCPRLYGAISEIFE
ncbi:hypothetical protein M9H77_27192 [Catharanthus roseus]|uniref:Uncharacterized protein n=1 Tax=Catharanthus roseus TaxID=4058 RepID=A0ACC0ACP0_CATRO|nr:hypothetical protein M9H77_27192 [Catharanthus roseus]